MPPFSSGNPNAGVPGSMPPTASRSSPWWGGGGSGSGGGTPTHDRPTPDSSGDDVPCYPLSKADSGFVSTGSRLGVRFSPSPYGGGTVSGSGPVVGGGSGMPSSSGGRGEQYTEWSPTGVHPEPSIR